ncbi:siderophore-interacting protein [Rhodobacter sphaeroides]|jgi:Siderophore-interacting protein|uniref:Siderophore-interacting protein n=1 Tax=Cereibacter sphaeroides (strain ATCC 17023 / DSM 158 / JCM 6121 / CCUG 31486 / LMG 2827 / NBRC 12203 / NCIMB 8253 / ATH 2.4.1.) TaxID=272943 RepID=Q3IVZ7_CERS4|nr:siderophore-interacting protein [Cereibacter sphaeroides]ABA81287.1 Siderophore-interacting protein [Cereibacter sphaeroides 2.4.1]AMJ49583.1 sialic acid transporter [Cereibacter sphaeroides]ANS36296.1 NADPH-dependent ferric siderophore reductase [Cereibacter sphaeroides]ATN65353.1 NADPH-dependent ferric siderophore reductase [Cereibacter sphaeroides]AXC63579.1 siderophore-interacting protein [Cereibacter sphaeroides 2.4.1]
MTLAQQTVGFYEGPLPEGLLDHIEEHVAAFEIPQERRDGLLRIAYGRGQTEIEAAGARLRIAIRAGGPVELYQLRESAMYLLDHVCPAAGKGIAWTGTPETQRPPSLHPATLVARERRGANFLRLTMGCAGTAALDAGPMHFSLLLSPEGRAPVWPRLDGRGRTVWPEGEEALHRAAYTFVALEPEANRFTFDLFLHEGSRASAWALSAPLGTKVAVMGPGGGDLPDAGEILLAGDETALPAIRRILETSAADRRGRVLIEIGDDGDRMPLRAPEQVEVTWLRRHAGETLLAALRAVDLDPDAPPPYLWVAAEQATVREARAHFRRDPRVASMRPYFSTYWRREG